MASEREPNQKVEIAHVLSMDLVGYSLLLITDQTRAMSELTSVVKNTEQFRHADAQGKLVRIPTGDGMSLVFFDDPQAPIECATEIASALKSHPDIRLRMGIHSGPVNEVIDVSDRSNVAGAGMDMAQRVMDCGDAGHILFSKRVAEDLAPFPRWHPHLHDLGECEVKHGRKIGLVNFYTNEIGNAEPPTKCAARRNTANAQNSTLRHPPFWDKTRAHRRDRVCWSSRSRSDPPFLPPEVLCILDKQGRGADKQSLDCRSAIRKREQRSERGVFVGRNF